MEIGSIVMNDETGRMWEAVDLTSGTILAVGLTDEIHETCLSL
jgi:hypothetical protein